MEQKWDVFLIWKLCQKKVRLFANMAHILHWTEFLQQLSSNGEWCYEMENKVGIL